MSRTPRSLSELELVWLTLFTKLRCAEAEAGTHPSSLAAPFLSTALPSYEPGGPGTVMLVGKATAGKNTLGEADVMDVYDAATVKQRTPAVAEEVSEGKYYGSNFLRFAHKLSDAGAEQARSHAAPFAEQSAKPFANLIWTNLAKIGVTEGNPPASLFREQDALAVETILAEASFYKPPPRCVRDRLVSLRMRQPHPPAPDGRKRRRRIEPGQGLVIAAACRCSSRPLDRSPRV